MAENYLSKHAEKRLYERTFFNEKSIIKLIDSKSFFFLGREIASNVIHCLVYQENTHEYFVVIKNEISNVVITILPLDYHINFKSKLNKEYIEINAEIKRRARLAATSQLTCDDLKLKITLKVRTIDKDGACDVHEIKKINFSRDKYYLYKTTRKKVMNILNMWRKKNKSLKVVGLSLSTGRQATPFEYSL